jgi:hypothetical protein
MEFITIIIIAQPYPSQYATTTSCNKLHFMLHDYTHKHLLEHLEAFRKIYFDFMTWIHDN